MYMYFIELQLYFIKNVKMNLIYNYINIIIK